MLNKILNSPRVGKVIMNIAAAVVCLVVLALVAYALFPSVFAPHLPDPVGQNCGSLDQFGSAFSIDSANCLWKDYQLCQTATLMYSIHGVDSGSTHVIIVRPASGGCSVSDSVESWVNTSGDRFASYTCAGMLPPADGAFSIQGCGDEGDLSIFAPD